MKKDRENNRQLPQFASARLSGKKSHLQLRADLVQAVRNFFTRHDYLEVETPIRIPAPAPEAYVDPVASGHWFLQASPELCMKQLLAAGFDRIFQICKCFRHAERGRRHLPELTMLEWYRAGGDYRNLMQDCEELIGSVARQLGHQNILSYQGRQIRLEPPWPRMTVAEAFARHASVSMPEALARDCFDEVIAEEIEPQLGIATPLFIYDYPASRAALARLKPDDHRLGERFELYIAGIELCNGFSELTDPVQQRTRFEKEQQLRRAQNKACGPMPENFLTALNRMPAACGNALGIDRLIMLFADAARIDEVVAFVPEEL
jgi:lysyl-tRNA synthetase class 2